jgi:hypothetical protein
LQTVPNALQNANALQSRLISLDGGKDWLVVSPDGFFDGSKGGWRYVSYRRAGTLELVDDGKRKDVPMKVKCRRS